MVQGQNARAAGLALLACAILSFIDNFVYLISQETGLWQFQVFRVLFALPLLFLSAKVLKLACKPKNLQKTAIRSVFVATGLLIYFAALGVLPVAQAGAGLYSSPIWVLVFSIVIFGVRVSVPRILAITGGFIGVLMLLQPDFTEFSAVSLFPLVAGAFYGLGMMATRHWCAEESAITLTIGVLSTIGVASVVALSALTIWPVPGEDPGFIFKGWSPVSGEFLLLTLGQAVGAVMAVPLITQAYRIGAPSYVAVFEYSFLVFAALWTYLLWSQGTNALAWFGIIVISVSGALATFVDRTSATASSHRA